MTRYAGVLAVALVLGQFSTVSAHAETAADFLKSIEGSYSGRGKAKLIGEKLDTVACKINNAFEDDRLEVSGECASTKGKSKVNGGIVVDGEDVAGNFVAPKPNLEITQSSGEFAEGQMTLSTSMLDHQKGGLIRVRQIISRTEDGIKADFFRYDNMSKSYKPSGSIDLKKKQAE